MLGESDADCVRVTDADSGPTVALSVSENCSVRVCVGVGGGVMVQVSDANCELLSVSLMVTASDGVTRSVGVPTNDFENDGVAVGGGVMVGVSVPVTRARDAETEAVREGFSSVALCVKERDFWLETDDESESDGVNANENVRERVFALSVAVLLKLVENVHSFDDEFVRSFELVFDSVTSSVSEAESVTAALIDRADTVSSSVIDTERV